MLRDMFVESIICGEPCVFRVGLESHVSSNACLLRVLCVEGRV